MVQAKTDLRSQATKLRTKGLSYRQIMEKVPVAKSTLSYWLRHTPLTELERDVLDEKWKQGRLRGAKRRHDNRIAEEKQIFAEAIQKINTLNKRELFLIGVALYWAEGNKQKPHNVSQSVKFNNSDPAMITLFLLWLKKVVQIPVEQIHFEIHIHETANAERARIYWSKIVKEKPSRIPIRLKRSVVKTNRHNTKDQYYGVLRINVVKSTRLNRQLSAWAQAISLSTYSGVV